MKTDSLFYRLFQRIPGLPMELAGLKYPTEGYVFRSEEIKQTAFRLDGVLIPPKESNDRPYVFIEAQIQPDEGFYSRFFSEIFLYLRQYNPKTLCPCQGMSGWTSSKRFWYTSFLN
ncbi:MAG: DUF2887 domain-containing protein [Proteobacteria bacterium]|nr:DUF2887 domain-containing protein [Pseudomonadota bacterium]